MAKDALETAEVGERLRRAREAVGESQEDVARSLNVSVRSVARWERVETAPSRWLRGAIEVYCKKAEARR